jgi:hypothetical protein
MNRCFHKIEWLVDKVIPYTLIILLFLIIGQIFFEDEIVPFHSIVSVIDCFIISIFILDLIFKYMRIKSFPKFFSKYWLEIIAVFPAFLVLRLIEEFVSLASFGEMLQTSFHEALEIEREGKLLVREVERTGKEASRLRYLVRYIKPVTRLPRFLKAFSFYEKPTGMHHPNEKM